MTALTRALVQTALHRMDMSITGIAHMYGVDRVTVSRWLADPSLPSHRMPSAHQLAELLVHAQCLRPTCTPSVQKMEIGNGTRP